MDKLVRQIRLMMLLALLLMGVGFLVSTLSAETVFLGIGISALGVAICLNALSLVARRFQLERRQDEERLKKLEEEIALLKKK